MNLRPCLHGNGSKRNRTQIGTDRSFVYTGADGTVKYRTAIRTQSCPRRKYVPLRTVPKNSLVNSKNCSRQACLEMRRAKFDSSQFKKGNFYRTVFYHNVDLLYRTVQRHHGNGKPIRTYTERFQIEPFQSPRVNVTLFSLNYPAMF